jgi:hypothetical protein
MVMTAIRSLPLSGVRGAHCFAALIPVLGTAALGPPAHAQAPGWTFDLTTYGWLSATDGTIGTGTLQAPVHNSFVDTIRQSDSVLSFMGRIEARSGRLGLFLDGMYSRLGYDDVRVGPTSVDATSTLGILEFGATWQLAEGNAWPGASWALDVLGGGRWTRITNEISFPRGIGGSSTTGWVDPFAGLRLRGHLADRWQYTLRGDIGGGTGGSRFAWQVIATVGYDFALLGLPATALVGYRALSQDFESAKTVWDVTLHGPLIGINLRF